MGRGGLDAMGAEGIRVLVLVGRRALLAGRPRGRGALQVLGRGRRWEVLEGGGAEHLGLYGVLVLGAVLRGLLVRARESARHGEGRVVGAVW